MVLLNCLYTEHARQIPEAAEYLVEAKLWGISVRRSAFCPSSAIVEENSTRKKNRIASNTRSALSEGESLDIGHRFDKAQAIYNYTMHKPGWLPWSATTVKLPAYKE